jgi:hypothetical protein
MTKVKENPIARHVTWLKAEVIVPAGTYLIKIDFNQKY